MALKRITLRDFVIVNELDLDLSPGFTVLTGETGAGKSILIDALQLVLGARSEAGVVREGANRADICAEFDLPPHLELWLQEAGLDEAEKTLLLRRTIDSQGKSRAWINGTPATATQLRQLGEALLDIHGQHAWQSLTRPESVRSLLDAYAQIDTKALGQCWQHWRAALQALDSARAAQATLQSEHERLSWQISELEKLGPGVDEWDDLSAQHTRQSHLQTLLETAQKSLYWLETPENSSSSDASVGALAQLVHAQSELQQQEHLEPEFKAITEVLASGIAQVEDAVHSLHAYLRRTELDPERLAELDQRLALWMGLARRYKRLPAELPALLQDWQRELTSLQAAADLEQLEQRCTQTESAYQKQARQISLARAGAAPRLSKAITQAMQLLGMKGGCFEVHLTPFSQPTANGLEEVEFWVSGHTGSTPKPIAKVASGGELSRLSLAIAVTTSQLGQTPTLIFDEVDSGVGGAVAQNVGQLMRQLGSDRQVLAVTHLAQVASYAHQHLLVSKQTRAGQTHSHVQRIDQQERTQEIARMLGGNAKSSTSLAHAHEMLSKGCLIPLSPDADFAAALN